MRRQQMTSPLSDHIGFHAQWRSWLFRPWRKDPGPRALVVILLLLLWQAANASGFLYGMAADRLGPRAEEDTAYN
jgi:hypothetical protein